MVRAPLHFHGRIPVPEVAPLTYRDGVTHLELVYELSQYLKNILHPSLQSTVDQVVADMERLLSEANDQYVDGIQEFQRIHDRFMSDVNASLMALNDTAVSDLLDDTTSMLRITLNGIVPDVVTDQNFNTLQAAIDATPEHSTLEVRREWVLSEPAVIDHPMTIHTVRNGVIRTTGMNRALDVTGSDVTVMCHITGSGADKSAPGFSDQIGVYVSGEPDDLVSNVVIKDSHIHNFSRSGVELWYTENSVVENNVIENISYAGLITMSSRHGSVRGNTIRNITQAGNYTNSYGITVSRDTRASVPILPVSSHFLIHGNTIDGVPGWEGIDTHGGSHLTITNNTVLNTNVGIAMVSSTRDSDNTGVAPTNLIISNNYVDSQQPNGSRSYGIQISGLGVGNDVTEYGDGVITNNIIKNHGRTSLSTSGSIQLQRTTGVVIQGNTIHQPTPWAIVVNIQNHSTVVENNIAIEPWGSGHCGFIRGINTNTTTLSGNVLTHTGAKGDDTALSKGVYSAGGRNSNNVYHMGINNFHEAHATNVPGGLDSTTMESNFLSFRSGTEPTSTAKSLRPALTNTDATSLLINQIREGLIEYGLFQS